MTNDTPGTIKITKRTVDALIAGPRPKKLHDSELRGFGARIYDSGAVAFVVDYRVNGARRQMTLGRPPELTADEARRRAKDVLAKVWKGEDPLQDRRTKRRELSVQGLIDLWEKENPPGRRSGKPMSPRVKQYTLARLGHHVIPFIGKRRVSEVSVADVNDVLRRVSLGETKKSAPGKRKRGRIKVLGGEGAARKVASDLSILMAFAIEKGVIATNPVSGARKPKAGKRYTYLTPDHLRDISAALTAMEREGFNTAGIAILRLLLLTGARPSEIEGLKWNDVDLPNRCLRLSDTKTGYSRRPLSLQAVEILSAQRRTDSPYVFPSTRGKGPFVSSKPLWNEARKRAKLPNAVRYEARHMVATLALSSGHDLPSVAALMGHAGPRTTLAIYAHVLDQNATRAADDVASKIAATMQKHSNDEQQASSPESIAS